MYQNSSSLRQQQPKLSSQQYSHLTVKQIKQQSQQLDIDYYTPIQTYFRPLNKTANKIKQLLQNQNKKQQMIYTLVQQIKQKDPQYIKLKQVIKQQLTQKGYNLSQMQSRRKTFAIDCLKQVMSYPFRQSGSQQGQQIMGYNFLPFWRLPLQKELRRVLWQKSLINQQTKRQFFTYDHQLTPYNIQTQFRLTIQRISQKQGIKLKQLQKDMAIKLLQYNVKRTQTLPNRSQVYMVLNIVQLFSYYNISRVNQIGAIYCGLQQLAEYYYQPIVDKRIQRILKVVQYVDVITFTMLKDYFFSNPKRQQQAIQQLNQIYEHFRMSLTSRYLPLNSSQYIIDQLLIKKRTLIDMYVMFAIVILVLGDHIQKMLQNSNNVVMNNNSRVVDDNKNIDNNNNPSQKSPLQQKLYSSPDKLQQSSLLATTTDISFKQIFQSSKQIIQLQQLVQSFNVVYEKIPASFSSNHQLSQTNRLFKYMLQVEKQSAQRLQQEKNKINALLQGGNNILVSQQQQLIQQLSQLKQQQSNNIGTSSNNFNNFLIINTDKLNYQRLGKRK